MGNVILVGIKGDHLEITSLVLIVERSFTVVPQHLLSCMQHTLNCKHMDLRFAR